MRDATHRAPGAPESDRYDSAHARLVGWLLDGPAQQRNGDHAGAVAGVVDAHGHAAYVYPEITGYYLQWLAWRARCGAPRAALASRAAAAHAWLAAWSTDARPATRVHVAAVDDWRNRASFTFDLAMALRGIAAAGAAGLIRPDAAAVARIAVLALDTRSDDGALEACRTHPGEPPLDARWSTRRGAFLAKAAGGLLDAAWLPGFPPALRDAAAQTLALACHATRTSLHAETHPALYAAEGLLARPDDLAARRLYPRLARNLTQLLARTAELGRMPEHATLVGRERLDIVAQALRVGCLLRAHGVAGAPGNDALDRLAATLADAVTPAGALAFAPSTEPSTLGVWAAMFAEQALAYWSAGDALASLARRPMLV